MFSLNILLVSGSGNLLERVRHGCTLSPLGYSGLTTGFRAAGHDTRTVLLSYHDFAITGFYLKEVTRFIPQVFPPVMKIMILSFLGHISRINQDKLLITVQKL